MGKKQLPDLQQLFEAYAEIMERKIQVAVEAAVKHGVEIGAKAAVKAVERERVKMQRQQYDWKYHNTKILLRNYRRLNEYFKNAVFEIGEAEGMDDSFEDIMRLMQNRKASDEDVVESIKRNYIHTKIIMTHVNRMLEVYRIMCERSSRTDEARHWRVLEGLYLSDDCTTADQIAKAEHIDKRTVYKDIDVCASDLTALLFGVSGIEKML